MSDYALGSSSDEAKRLIRQAQYLAPHTQRVLAAAGVGAGTRVLDLGSGMGDVALVAEALGAEVVGVERDPQTIERARVRLVGKRIELVQGQLPDVAVAGRFDVICGRLILMYLPDPVAALRALAERFLKPDGAIAFVEYDFRAPLVLPSPALGKHHVGVLRSLFDKAGCATDLGLRLPQVFAAAGFATPSLDAFQWTASHPDDVGFDMVPSVLAAMKPLAERLGIAGTIDPDLPTLADRLRAASRDEGTFLGPLVVGAAAKRA